MSCFLLNTVYIYLCALAVRVWVRGAQQAIPFIFHVVSRIQTQDSRLGGKCL